ETLTPWARAGSARTRGVAARASMRVRRSILPRYVAGQRSPILCGFTLAPSGGQRRSTQADISSAGGSEALRSWLEKHSDRHPQQLGPCTVPQIKGKLRRGLFSLLHADNNERGESMTGTHSRQPNSSLPRRSRVAGSAGLFGTGAAAALAILAIFGSPAADRKSVV